MATHLCIPLLSLHFFVLIDCKAHFGFLKVTQCSSPRAVLSLGRSYGREYPSALGLIMPPSLSLETPLHNFIKVFLKIVITCFIHPLQLGFYSWPVAVYMLGMNTCDGITKVKTG